MLWHLAHERLGGDANVYKDLRFPEEVYESIAEYFEQKQEASEDSR